MEKLICWLMDYLGKQPLPAEEYIHGIGSRVMFLLKHLKGRGLYLGDDRRIVLAACLSDFHDIGKSCIPTEILKKPSGRGKSFCSFSSGPKSRTPSPSRVGITEMCRVSIKSVSISWRTILTPPQIQMPFPTSSRSLCTRPTAGHSCGAALRHKTPVLRSSCPWEICWDPVFRRNECL